MAEHTAISWTNATWNPTVGCTLVSPGCTNCYAMKVAHRNALRGARKYEGLTRLVKDRPVWNGVVRVADEKALNEPRRWKEPKLVFVNSMSDLFHESLPEEAIFGILDRMMAVPRHIYQVLTKRPERMRVLLERYVETRGAPLPDFVWFGTSVEDQVRAEERLPALAAIPAPVRFVSMEPLQGPVDLTGLPVVEWYIVGGESVEANEPRAQAAFFDPDWARAVLAHCRATGAAFHFKQLGSNTRVETRHRKGGDPSEWDADLMVQDWPTAIAHLGRAA